MLLALFSIGTSHFMQDIEGGGGGELTSSGLASS